MLATLCDYIFILLVHVQASYIFTFKSVRKVFADIELRIHKEPSNNAAVQ